MSDTFDLRAVRQLAESAEFTEPDLYAALAAACDEIERLNDVDARNDLFADCLHRALKIWQGDNPDADHWPDGAWTIAWILRNNEQLRADNARLTANYAALDKTASTLYQEVLHSADMIARLQAERDALKAALETAGDTLASIQTFFWGDDHYASALRGRVDFTAALLSSLRQARGEERGE